MLPLSDATLRSLAPLDLRSRRTTRYLGDSLSIELAVLAPDDRQLAHDLYALLGDLYATVTPLLSGSDGVGQQLAAFAQRSGWNHRIRQLREFGRASRDAGVSQAVQMVIHDLRGGAVQALTLHFQLLDTDTLGDAVTQIFLLTRDQLKIMRNAVVDLDPDGAARDRQERLHNVQLLTEKWHHAIHGARDRRARIFADVRFAGSVSERCVEFAALDRALYNLINNATQHAADEHVFLTILPIPDGSPASLRFVVANRVTDEQQQRLVARGGEQLSWLFAGGFTTGGTGLGMRICADFVTNAFGLASLDAAVQGGYVGARLLGSAFVAWFHWPIVAD
jgi:signal transduction histidine kinase